MNLQQRKVIARSIKYELQEGTHTFTHCQCGGRHGCRSGQCWECLLKLLVENKKVNVDFLVAHKSEGDKK